MKVIVSEESLLKFDNGLVIEGEGDQNCCEHNYLDFEQLPVGTELPDADANEFITQIVLKEDGFVAKDIYGTPKWVQARSIQDGYYSNMTTLKLIYNGRTINLGKLCGN
jgi:hypothetical protein